MELVQPGLGLMFWMVVTFGLLMFLLTKFAWKPIMKALGDREKSIEDALSSAEKAREEMSRLNADSEKLLKEARTERDRILKEAKQLHDTMVNDAKGVAQQEGAKMIEKAKAEISAQKTAALNEIKEQVATLSLDIAEKVLRKKFENKTEQEAMVASLLGDIKLN